MTIHDGNLIDDFRNKMSKFILCNTKLHTWWNFHEFANIDKLADSAIKIIKRKPKKFELFQKIYVILSKRFKL